MDPHALNVYTDGSSPKNPGVGGIGVRFIFPDNYESLEPIQDFNFPGYKGGGIGLMEIMAGIEALKEVLKLPDLHKIKRVVIHSDSMYFVDGYKSAIYSWSKKQWRKLDGSPVSNTKEWKDLLRLAHKLSSHGLSLDIKKVQGHSTDIHNRAVDKLAKKSATFPIKNISQSSIVRRKNTKNKTVKGSIQGLGQRIKIRVITSEYLSLQKESKYRCEIISKGSVFYGKADFLFSKEVLRPAHSYLVILSGTGTYLQIKRVIKELE